MNNLPSKPRSEKLGLPELLAMVIGGMIGGGIFSVLGMAVGISGHAAPFAFLVGSFVALAAGYSYVKLAIGFHSDGASFTYLERTHRPLPALNDSTYSIAMVAEAVQCIAGTCRFLHAMKCHIPARRLPRLAA